MGESAYGMLGGEVQLINSALSLIDVGRSATGSLVLIETLQDITPSRDVRLFARLPDSEGVPLTPNIQFSRVTPLTVAREEQASDNSDVESSDVESNDRESAKDERGVQAPRLLRGLPHAEQVAHRLRALREIGLREIGLRAIALSVLPSSVRKRIGLERKRFFGMRGVRLAATFMAVGVVLLLILLGGIGGRDSDELSGREKNTSATTGEILEAKVQDPVDYALAEVRAGRVPGLGRDDNADGAVEGRVLSRNGDIILVEVIRVSGTTKTFATLLLQKMETGWRTRDVFEAAS